MAADNLPSEFDVVILGTDTRFFFLPEVVNPREAVFTASEFFSRLTESVIAAACSRVGHRVLHVDRRTYYAGNWASFTFNGLLSWIEEYEESQKATDEVQSWREKLEDGEEALLLNTVDASISNLEVFTYASKEPEEEEEKKEEAVSAYDQSLAPESEGERGDQDAGSADGQEQPDGDVPADVTPDQQPQAERPPQEDADQPPDTEETPATRAVEAKEVQSEEPSSDEMPVQAPKVAKKINYAKILKEGRRFNIDLVSKLMYSRGLLVDLLIKSHVSRYAEFKNVGRILTYRNGKVEQVPCSRADVFGSKQLSVVEKRMLMKFLTFCLDFEQHPEEYLDFTERSFWEFLQTKKLTENLQHFVLHAIAMVPPETRTGEGLRSTQHFLRSLGRYGNTPFLFPIYGFGEIPQCFCRMCAVFGGIYCLRHSVQCLVLDKESGRCKALIDTCGQRISCSHFVVEEGYIREEQHRGVEHRLISRAVLITDRSLLQSDSEQQISLVTVPPLDPGTPAVQIIELCSSTMTCMPGTYLVHLTCPSSRTAREDLAPIISRLFVEAPGAGEEVDQQDERPSVLWALYFNLRDSTAVDKARYDLPSNVYVCSGPDATLGSDHSIRQAEEVFRCIAPDEEFCPPAPNPEDVVFDGDGPQGEGAGFGQPAEGEEVSAAGREEGDDGTKEQTKTDQSEEQATQALTAGLDEGVAPPSAPPTEE